MSMVASLSVKPEKTASTCFSRDFPAFCTGLFSATQTEAVVQLARAGLRNAVRIKVAVVPSAEQQQQQTERVASGQTAGPSGAQRTPSSLEIQYQICDSVQKLRQLVKFIQVRSQSILVRSQSILKHTCVLVMVETHCWCSVIAQRSQCLPTEVSIGHSTACAGMCLAY